MLLDSSRTRIGVLPLPVPNIKGEWTGMEHKIRVELTNGMNELELYSVGLIDTVGSKDSGTSYFDIHFMSVSGKPYIEVIDWNISEQHGFHLTTSTYLKIHKLSTDTIIVQMLNSGFTEGWLRTKGYHYFKTADEKIRTDPTLYLTEDLGRLARMLKELYNVPAAFQIPDTLVRVQ